jgi:hypothetical protein
MSNIKTQLKAAGEAIKAQKWDEAIQFSQSVISKDAKNYQAYGRSKFPYSCNHEE